MLFVEGNHFCMFCEKSGNCELQALAYRFGITAPQVSRTMFPDRDVDASHPDIFIDRNRCILCGRCVRASRDLDGKNVFEFVGRGTDKKIWRQRRGAAGRHRRRRDRQGRRTSARSARSSRSASATRCRSASGMYDHKPIGSDIEADASRRKAVTRGARIMAKPKVATTSLAGCFGCHMSILDIDERILQLIELVDFDKSPIDDIKEFTGPVRHRPDRGRLLQRGERARAAGLPQALRRPDLARRLRHHAAASRPCATTSRCRSASTRPT